MDIERIKCNLRRDGYAVIDPFLTPEQLEIVQNVRQVAMIDRQCPRLMMGPPPLRSPPPAPQSKHSSPSLTDEIRFILHPFQECETLRELATERGSPWATAAASSSCIFETLPGHLCDSRPDLRTSYTIYKTTRSTWPLQAAAWDILFHSQLSTLAIALLGPQATLFNDQYIVKPPHSGAAASFKWHRDSDWCREGTASAPYISIWVALDDMTPENGCLVVRPKSHATSLDLKHIPGLEPEEHLQEAGPPTPLPMPAGAAVVTADVVEHASGPNKTPHSRRAWMPQFSVGPVTWKASGAPVSLAIPLMASLLK